MKNNKRKVSILTVCLLLTVLIAVGSTIAYIFTSTDPVKNTFTPVEPGTEIEEFLENNVKKNVTVKNTGEVDAYIRAKVVITWQNAAGEVYKTLPTADDYTINWNVSEALVADVWYKGSDGFYYYTSSVPAMDDTTTETDERETAILINSVTPNKSCEDSSYTLHVEILTQAVQSTPDNAVSTYWPVTAKDGVLTSVS